MPDYNQIINQIKDELLVSLKGSYGSLKGEAAQNLQNFMIHSEESLKGWMNLLAEKKIGKEEFADLIMAQKDLLKVELLKIKGMSQIEFDKLKLNVLQIIIKVVIASI